MWGIWGQSIEPPDPEVGSIWTANNSDYYIELLEKSLNPDGPIYKYLDVLGNPSWVTKKYILDNFKLKKDEWAAQKKWAQDNGFVWRDSI